MSLPHLAIISANFFGEQQFMAAHFSGCSCFWPVFSVVISSLLSGVGDWEFPIPANGFLSLT
jgi:hypothetical protein